MPAYDFVEDILRPFMRQPMKLGTARSYRASARILEEHFAGLYCTDSRRTRKKTIDGAKVAAFREKRKLTGASVATVKHDIALASRACNWAIADLNYDFRNPFQGRGIASVDRGKIKADKTLLSAKDAAAILAHLEGVYARIFKFLLFTGFRTNEALRLSLDRVVGDSVRFNREQNKSSREQTRALRPEALALLNTSGTWAFTREDGPVPYWDFNRRFRQARKRAGLDHLKAKHARNTCGQLALEHGASLQEVKELLGHSSLTTTESWYVSPSLDLARRAANRAPVLVPCA